MISWGRAFQLRQRLKGNLWALPLVGGVLGWALAEIVAPLDRALDLPSGWQYTSGAASSVLAAIVGAMIGLLGFVVTVTVLVVQQATGTLSPRYMRLWYRDRLQKVVLAFFVGTFTYSYSLLRKVEANRVPNLGVTIAGIAVGASLVLLLLYVNRFTHNLRPVAVAAAVAATGQRVLATYDALRADEAPGRDLDPSRLGAPTTSIRAPRSGAIQAVAAQRLVDAASRHDWVLVLAHPVGDSLPAGSRLIDVYGEAPRKPSELAGLIAVDTERTIDQDPAFAMRILVDVAIRALSPAVNDPTTAVQVLGYVEDMLQSLVRMPLRSHYTLADERGLARLVIPGRSWSEFLALGVTEIRQYGANAPQICRRLRAVLEDLLAVAPADRRAEVSAELDRLDASIDRTFPDDDTRTFVRTSDRQGIGGRSGEPLPAAAEGARAGPPALSPQRHDVPPQAQGEESAFPRAFRAEARDRSRPSGG